MDRTYRNASEAFLCELNNVMKYGAVLKSRNGLCRELTDVCMTIKNPLERCFFIPGRNDNIFAKVAETVWMLSGRNDIDWLLAYLPRAAEWSDDGKTWRGGYGPRLRSWNGNVDQVKECARLLLEDSSSRRAVMSIYDPATDYQDTKDVPCNDWIHWLIRDGYLDMKVAQRSSDILWGFSGINTFEWSVLHQLMASWTNSRVGKLTYFISSLHLYEPHWKRANIMLENFPMYPSYPATAEIELNTPIYALDYVFDSLFEQEQSYRNGYGTILSNTQEMNMWSVVNYMFALYWMRKQGAKITDVVEFAMNYAHTDIGISAIIHLCKDKDVYSVVRDRIRGTSLLEFITMILY